MKTRQRSGTEQADEKPSEGVAQQEEESVCPECDGRLDHDSQRGETSCVDCGLVVDGRTIDRGPEWRAFNSTERNAKSRVGAPTNKMMHDDGLSTVIDWRDRDASGNSLNTRQREKMRRLRKWNRRFDTRDSKDRNLRQALGEIQRMASALGVPRGVREIASMIYRRCLNDGLLPGRSIEGVSTAALYAATRMEDMPRSLTEMERVSRVGEMEIGRAYRYIDRELSLGIGPSDPARYIPRFTADLDVSQETVRLAERLVTLVQENGLHWGKSPPGIAGAAIYMAGQLNNETPTQSDLADVTGMTEVTIRERYQDMINHFEERWLHRQ